MHYQRCVLSEIFTIDDIENPIPIDTSAEEWIKEILKYQGISELKSIIWFVLLSKLWKI